MASGPDVPQNDADKEELPMADRLRLSLYCPS
jgi:hypothetical protein